MARMTAALLGFAVLVLLCTAPVAGWDDCPRGCEDTCPHRCMLYTDTNGDGICDHAQDEPAAAEGEGATAEADASSPNRDALLMPLAAIPALLGALAFLFVKKR